ncbi:polysaccharide pyruvyl transferase family protein [Thioflexithrix psekupsensis]|uniref:Polysaccharide pyruvyl transferase domain-containing protein n=1 Tax=Thioflexithrix psekupsensis TaxID=1570016 RepID=A0A251X8X9_9GAMM|nr:polysaccharide pyruvyl transferase family protein [Thioflexithrix psekupsensis]OUD14123.1 hypothetical protein TPSD3_07250 [Thioflexithrix psekupsensis]
MSEQRPKIWLLGASFETPNMGVSALAEASLKCLIHHWPNAHIMLRSFHTDTTQTITIDGKTITLHYREMWFGRNVLKPQNIYLLLFYALIVKIIPPLRGYLMAKNRYFQELMEIDIVADITGGDSFSDIYGLKRLFYGSMTKFLGILCAKKFVMLPQTYGPFKGRIARFMARRILNNSDAIYARDKTGAEYVRGILGEKNKALVQFVPDVAFVLDAESPQSEILTHIEKHRDNGQVIIGLNVSGLLYNRHYQAEQHFGLNTTYATLMVRLIETLLAQANTVLILVPHVFDVKGHFESDPDACEDLYQRMHANYSDRLFVVTDTLNHRQVKYVIGQCDFFLGSRMHACIAALSQGIPAVGLAYSGKFHGVFDSVGAANNVIDLRKVDEAALLSAVQHSYQTREEVAHTLKQTVPAVKHQLMHLFQHFTL